MRKRLIGTVMVLVMILLASGSALAWDGHRFGHRGHFGLGVFIGPPVVSYGPPTYYTSPARVWVPGYWDWRWSGRGWVRIWVPGYWQWR